MDTMRRIVGYRYPASVILLHGDGVNPDAGPDTYSLDIGWYTLRYFKDSSAYDHPVGRLFPGPPAVSKPVISGGGRFASCISAYASMNYIYWPHHEAFNFQEYDFTVDFWFKASSLFEGFTPDSDPSAGEPSNSSVQVYLNFHGTPGNYLSITLGKYTRRQDEALGWGWDAAPIFQVQHKNAAGDILTNYGVTHCVAGAWYHVAFVKAGNLHRLYLNGAVEAQWSCVSSFFSGVNPSPVYPANYHRIYIVTPPETYGIMPLYIDEFHMEAGAKWTDAFTPPTEPYDG